MLHIFHRAQYLGHFVEGGIEDSKLGFNNEERPIVKAAKVE